MNLSQAIQTKLVARLQYEIKKREIVDACLENRRLGIARATREAKKRLETEYTVSISRGEFELSHELGRIERDLARLEQELRISMQQTKEAMHRLETDFPTVASGTAPGPFSGPDHVYFFTGSRFLDLCNSDECA
jgi:hypothetical protein